MSLHDSAPMSTRAEAGGTKTAPSRPLRRDMVGKCLRCGSRLTLCGRPFSAEIPCVKCFCINIYVASRQPVAVR
jgi:hypothetical protein